MVNLENFTKLYNKPLKHDDCLFLISKVRLRDYLQYTSIRLKAAYNTAIL